jgi:hypothetical protein
MTKKTKKKTKTTLVRKVSKLTIAKYDPAVKLDLACGQTPIEGFEGVDLYAPNAKHKVDLFKFPYPWASDSVDEIHCSHFAEHLPARPVEASDINTLAAREFGVDASKIIGKDFLFAFMDECFRILKRGARGIEADKIETPSPYTLKIIVPNARSNRGFQDPTHRRFFVAETFLYFWKGWREVQKLDHYNVSCDFRPNIGHSMGSDLALLADEVRAVKFNESWNVIADWIVTLHPAK